MKIPLLIEVIGDSEAGKTTFGCKMLKPLLIDMSVKGEAHAIVKKWLPDELWRWKGERDFKKIKDLVNDAVSNDEITTVVFDPYSDLQKAAGKLYLEVVSAKSGKHRESVLQIEYGNLTDMIEDEFTKIFKAGKNVIVTSSLRDKYRSVILPDGDVKSIRSEGQKERQGYPRAPKACDLRLYLKLTEDINEGTKAVSTRRTCTVVKNRFRNKAETKSDTVKDGWVSLLDPIEWETLVELVTDGTGIDRGDLTE